MEINKNFWAALGAIGTFVAIVLAGVTLYINRERSTSLEIKKINEVELTRPLNVTRLSSTYLYDDSIPVEHLWQTSYVIKNTGETTIYGEGFDNKTIRGNALKLFVNNCVNLLSLKITETNTDAFLINDSIKFIQWRPNEYVELMVVSDSPQAPEILISERDIQNATISYVTYSPQEQLVEAGMMDKLPKTMEKTLWWIIIIVESISIFILVLAGISQIIQAKTKKDKTTNLFVFLWIVMLILFPILWMF